MGADSKVAIVTGAGSGIGRATALALPGDGYSVVLAGCRRDALEQTVAEVGMAAARVLVVPADVTDPASVVALNAGAGAPAVPPGGLGRRAVAGRRRRQSDWPLPLHTVRLPADGGPGPRGGRIVNIGSVSAHAPRPRSAPSAAS